MFKYLEIQNQNYLAFYPCYQYITSVQDTNAKIRVGKYLYNYAVDELPPNEPKPRGWSMQIIVLDSDHASDKVTRLSQTGILLYLNSAPTILYSKKKIRYRYQPLVYNYWLWEYHQGW